MTDKQKSYLEMYKSEADKAYASMHDFRIDYDTFKPIADASSLMTEQAKKVYDKLYPIYINYPIFLKGLKGVYDKYKQASDDDQQTLQKKLEDFTIYKSQYDTWIGKINALETQIYEDELSSKIDEIANIPENLVRSNELALIEEEKERLAAEKAAQEAALKASIEKDKITGEEVCLDNMGNRVDMSICRPNTNTNTSSSTYTHVDTPSDIVNRNIDEWLRGIEQSFEKTQAQNNSTSSSSTSTTKGSETEDKKEGETTKETTPTEEKEKSDEPVNTFVFNADLSKLIAAQKAAGDVGKTTKGGGTIGGGTSGGGTSGGTSGTTILGMTNSETKILTFGAILVAGVVAYELMKKKS